MLFKIAGLPVTDAHDGRAAVHTLHNGDLMPIIAPPTRNGAIPQETHEASEAVQKVAQKFALLDATRGAAAKDQNLSEIGRKRQAETARQATIEAVREARTMLDQIEAKATTLTAEAYAPPKIAAGDLEGALVDQEIRAYVRDLRDKSLTAYAEALPKNTRHLEAVLRSPVPIPLLSEVADRAWKDHLKTSPKAVRARGYADAVEWARGAVGQIEAKV